ncbi:MAG: hypothetical protein VCE43_10860 [Myxococcota bacterium]
MRYRKSTLPIALRVTDVAARYPHPAVRRTLPVFHGDAVLVEYPTRRAFLEMVNLPEYQQAHEDRDSGLERTTLIACTQIGDGFDWADFS